MNRVFIFPNKPPKQGNGQPIVLTLNGGPLDFGEYECSAVHKQATRIRNERDRLFAFRLQAKLNKERENELRPWRELARKAFQRMIASGYL